MIVAKALGKTYVVEDHAFSLLYSKGYGTKEGKVYVLDVYELAFLMETEKVSATRGKQKLSVSDVLNAKGLHYSHFLVYKDLRKRGYLVKSAMKYGFPFRVYPKGAKAADDHALYLVEVLHEKDDIKARELSGKNRITHSTNKKLLIAIVDSENSINYIETGWVRL